MRVFGRHLWVALVWAAVLLGPSLAAANVFEPREFDNAEQEDRYRELIAELRCLVCQNQSLADSNAELASDLRREVYDKLGEGADDETIIQFMVDRYGDFVLYRPPVKTTTLMLWAGPFLIAVVGIAFLVVRVRRRASAPEASADLTGEDKARLASILEEVSAEQPEDRDS